MDEDAPGLSVGFAIDFHDSFGQLKTLDDILGETAAEAVREFRKIEAASKGAVNLGDAVAQIETFRNAATRADRDIARSKAQTEKAAERLIRQLEREAEMFGRTRDQVRSAKAEMLALEATQQGNSDLAQRLTAAEAALYDKKFAAARQARFEADAAAEAQAAEAARAAAALKAETAAVEQLAREHRLLADAVRASHAAQVADAEAAERMRMATDPLYAATKRLNEEIAESTRLYHVGATAPEEYARQQLVLAQRLKATTAQHEAMTVASRKNALAMQMVAMQAPDIVQGLLSGQRPMQVFIQQGGQIAQIGMMAEGGLKGFSAQLGLLTLRFAPFAVAAGIGWGAIKLFQQEVKDSGELTRYRDGLGLTHKEMLQLSDGVDKAGGKIKELTDVTVTTGDVMAGLWKTIADQANVDGAFDSIKSGAAAAFGFVLDAWNATSAGITAGIYGTANAAKVIWNNFATSVGDAFYQSVNLAIDAMNALVKAGTDILNGFAHAANKIPGVNIGDLTAPKIGNVTNPYAGAAGQDAADAAAKAISDGYTKAYADARKADAEFWKQVGENAKQTAKDRLKAEADALKANRTTKPDRHAEQLAREAAAIEAQIRNLYALANAYQVSGAAALIAEARVKAESRAIKQRGDIEVAVDRQIRLAIAQRVADGEKGAAAVREQADAQAKVNDLVAGGIVPAERAAELVRDQIADLPLLAAIQVAQQRGLSTETERATQALADQRRERARLREEEQRAQFNSDMAAGANRLDQLREELRLVGATDAARTHALAEQRATQEALAKFDDPSMRVQYILQQTRIADETERTAASARELNDALSFTAEIWDLIDRNVQNAARGMADAFGEAGRDIGDLAAIYSDYRAQQEREDAKHDAAMKAATSEAMRQNELVKHALATSTAQIGLFGDMTAAAKGFFSEGSRGYKDLEAAEKAFRAVEFAMSVRSIAQDAIETGSKLASSAARTAANAVEAVTKAIASLPFPANLAAGAATVAALAAIGVSIGGSLFGGGGKNTLEQANTGAGTVLGDPSAQSASIKNAIDALKEVDTLTNTYAREMSASLKSIDSQIGNLATVLVRGGDINASQGISEGFKTNTIGSILGAIPLVGGLLSSLFGSKTTVIGSGLYAGSQSLGSILDYGFDGSTYSDIQRKKKFLGITTSTKYSTQYGSLSSSIEDQFTLLLRSFNDAIAAAAGPLGQSTEAIEAKLRGFVVNIGKVDLKGLTGEQIEEKLQAIFGAAADKMANAAFPGIAKFQQVGEGAFETLVRVAATVEQVTNSLDRLGAATTGLSIEAKLGLADRFESVSDLTSAVNGYFDAFYTKEEQVAAQTAEMTRVFDSLGLTMPDSLAAFRALVEAQNLNTEAGRATYATLLQLAPAFADLQEAMNGAKSAADIASERESLERQILQLQGNTAALRALDLAKLDASNRALQEQVWAIQDAQEAAKAADDLRKAWQSVGDSIEDEIKRIRGLTQTGTGTDFATLMGQFSAATAAARGGDIEAAKSLPQLSQALLTAAELAATSRQELDRVRAQTAASLETTNAAIDALANAASSDDAILAAAASAAQATAPSANDNQAATLSAAIDELREEMAQMRSDTNSGLAAVAGNTGAIKRKLDDVTAASGGDAISTVAAA